MDTEFKEHVINEVRGMTDGWEMMLGDGLAFYCSKEWGVEPRIGDTARLYGKGFGYTVRGLSINGKVCYYRTPEQEKNHQHELRENSKQKQREEFERQKAQLDAVYADLHPVFTKRIDKFRKTNPDFRWQFEAYEMLCCTDAQNISAKLKTVEAIKAWSELPYEEQIKQVSIWDGHSGNSFACAKGLAIRFLQDPKSVILAHGALTPLTGCKDYGCPHPYEIEEEDLDG